MPTSLFRPGLLVSDLLREDGPYVTEADHFLRHRWARCSAGCVMCRRASCLALGPFEHLERGEFARIAS